MFLETITLTVENVSESQLYPRSEQKLKRTKAAEQQRHDLQPNQTNAIFVSNLEIWVYFSCQTESRRFGGPNNNYFY